MRLYLYLARRDHTGVTVLSIFDAPRPVEASRLENPAELGLPAEEALSLQRLFVENRMDWEPWIETADDYPQLKGRLEGRGYKNVPTACKPSHSSYSYTDPYTVEKRFTRKPSMLRRATP